MNSGAPKVAIFIRILEQAKPYWLSLLAVFLLSSLSASLTLLHSPLFPVKQIKGKNIDDGIIFYPNKTGGSPCLVMVSAKSSKNQKPTSSCDN